MASEIDAYGTTGLSATKPAMNGYGSTTTVELLPIHVSVMALGSDIEKLAAGVCELEQRLCSVLRPTGPELDRADPGSPDPPHSQHHQLLEAHRMQLARIGRQAQDILSRLEI